MNRLDFKYHPVAMAPIFKSLALVSALFAAISSAAPVNLDKREVDVVWTTVTTVVWTTIDVTTTIYPTPQAPTPPVVESTPTPTPSAAPEQAEPIETSTQPETTKSQPTQPSVATFIPVAAAAAAADSAAPIPEEPAPQPATTAAPSTSTTTQAAPSAPPAANSGSTEKAASSGYSGPCSKGSPCVGQLTYYDTATSASAPSSCGLTNDGFSENVVALPVGIMTDADCGKTVTITYNGITKTATVVDKCMGCKPTDLDASRHLFGELADFSAGRIDGMSWYFN